MTNRLTNILKNDIKDKEVCLRKLAEALKAHGYVLTSEGLERFYRNVRVKVYKLRNIKSAKILDSVFTFSVKPEEVAMVPREIIETGKNTIDELQQELFDEKEKYDQQASLFHEELLAKEEFERKLKLLTKDDSCLYRGKPFSDVSRKQQLRQLNQISEKATEALWFVESYNLQTHSIRMIEKTSKEEVEVPLAVVQQNESPEPATALDSTSALEAINPTQETTDSEESQEEMIETSESNIDSNGKRQLAFEKLPINEKTHILEILSVMTKYSISLAGYHKLSRLETSLPRSYLVEACMRSMDALWREVMEKTPGSYSGIQVPFKMLLKKEIQNYLQDSISARELSDQEEIKIQIKIAGDGTVLSKSSTLFVLSFCILNEGAKVMSSAGNHTIAAVKAPEKHDALKECLKDVLEEVNELIREGYIMVNGRRVKLEIFLGGDYKFLLLALGVKGANGNHACIYCKLHKKDRSDLSKTTISFKSSTMERRPGPRWAKDPGCEHQPLLDIALSDVCPDELHLLMRVTDRLEEGIITDTVQWDQKENEHKPKWQWTTTRLDNLIKTIRSCGVSFSTWQGKEKLEWTSMPGSNKKLVLYNLPGKLEDIVSPERVDKTKNLWKGFQELYNTITSLSPTEEQVSSFHERAKQWGKLLISMNYASWSCPITPYLHVMIYHIPERLNQAIPLKMFTGQGVEKKNDEYRRFFHHAINRWDACRSLVCLEKRQERLIQHDQAPRMYRKRNQEFWYNGGKAAVARKILKQDFPARD